MNKKLCIVSECTVPGGSVVYCDQVNYLVVLRFDFYQICIKEYISVFQPSSNNKPPGDGAPEEKLEYVYQNLKQHVPEFFVGSLDYSICHKNIIFENRIRGKTYK